MSALCVHSLLIPIIPAANLWSITQVESFIPLWEWDVPKKKGKKKRAEDGTGKKSKKASKAEAAAVAAGATIEEVVESATETSGLQRRTATVEDVADEDD